MMRLSYIITGGKHGANAVATNERMATTIIRKTTSQRRSGLVI
jgi:hypothetical protein